jgi:protein ImuA
LRDRMRRLEKPRAAELPVLSLGVAAIDDALPWGGLPGGSLHEIVGRPGDAAATGFATWLLTRLAGREGQVLWCRGDGREPGIPYAPALAQAGLAPERLIVVETNKPAERLWAMEEALRAQAFAAVLAEDTLADLTATRRLQLAAEAGRTTALLLLSQPLLGRVSAALTRWQVTAVPVEAETERVRWQLALARCRNGAGGIWHVVPRGNTHETLSLHLAATLVDRPLAAAVFDQEGAD